VVFALQTKAPAFSPRLAAAAAAELVAPPVAVHEVAKVHRIQEVHLEEGLLVDSSLYCAVVDLGQRVVSERHSMYCVEEVGWRRCEVVLQRHFLDHSAHPEGQEEEHLHDLQAIHLDYGWHLAAVKLLVDVMGSRQYRSDGGQQAGSGLGAASRVPDDPGVHYVLFHVVLKGLVVAVMILVPSVGHHSLVPFRLDRGRSQALYYSLTYFCRPFA
jgi:hypothetical protein